MSMTAEDKKALERADEHGVLVVPVDRNDLAAAHLRKCYELCRPFVAVFTRGVYAEVLLLMKPMRRLLSPTTVRAIRWLLWQATVEGGRIQGGQDWAYADKVPTEYAEALGIVLHAAAYASMTTAEFVKYLRQRGISLEVKGDGFQVDGPVDADILTTLSFGKHEENLRALIREHGPIRPE